MAYKLKSIQEFDKQIEDYLEKHPIEFSYKKNIIDNFSSQKLSDLYGLFLNLKGHELSNDLLNDLKNIIKTNYSIDVHSIFQDENENTISENNIDSLANIIKDKFSEQISSQEDSAKNNIDEDELYKLSVIVNKLFPSFFLSLISNPNSDIEQDQKIIKDRILNTIDNWHQHNLYEAELENRDILGALYITASKLNPELDIYIPGRIKSTKSSIDNINKETLKSINTLLPSDLSVGLTNDDISKQFNIEKANTDFSGITIVLSNTDDTLHFDMNEPKTEELLELRELRKDNIYFSHILENFLFDNDSTVFSDIELLQMKIELLMRLRLTTYEECTKEYNGTSFTKLLQNSLKLYNDKKDETETENDTDYTVELEEIYQLLDELRKRIHDKYQAKILEITVPDLLQDDFLTDTLKLKPKFVKRVKKENGFCADYYELETNNGRKIELQALTKLRFKESKDGSSDHSNLPNKKINIEQFFEPSFDSYSDTDFSKLLKLLGETPIALKNTLYATPDQQLSATDRRLKKRLRIAEQNIKLKDSFEYEFTAPDGTTYKSSYPIDKYLIHFAEFVSPRLMSVSSHHTRFHKGVAGYSKKSIVSCFTEVLLEHDSTSCLAQILIDKLESIVPNDKSEISRNGIINRANKRYTNNDSFER